VVGLDVIEHVPEPQETLRLVAAHLAPNGILLMTTGDWAAVVAKLMGASWRLMTPPQHLSFFTARSMSVMLESAGFQVLSLTHPWKYVPATLVAYQLQRILGLKPRPMTFFKNLALPINLWDAMRVVAVKR
jgi:2-polyprenyl-3-methyl-5-hydroxy-6-metoxy-1,4-benzoquinol methylase